MQNHKFDIVAQNVELDLFAEELPEQVQLASDCLSSLGSVCGVSSVGSIISTGSDSAS
jgi:hypothetical protein